MIQTDDVGCLDKGPLQIPIHIWTQPAVAELVPRGMHPGCCTRAGSQTRGCRETRDLTSLQKNDDSQDKSHPRKRLQKLQFLTSPLAEGFAGPFDSYTILGQSGMNAVLQSAPLPSQHHPCTRQVPKIPNLSGRNPRRRQSIAPRQRSMQPELRTLPVCSDTDAKVYGKIK
jgi:hypothetical protein